METTLFLTKLIGVYALISGLSLLLKRKMVMQVMNEFFKNRMFSYVIGLFELLLGLFLVLSGPIAEGAVGFIVKLFGWLAIIEGTVYLFVSEKTLHSFARKAKNRPLYYLLVVLYLGVGVWLSYMGFVVK